VAIEAAARTVEAPTAALRNVRRETRGFFEVGGVDSSCGAGCEDVEGAGVAVAADFFSPVDIFLCYSKTVFWFEPSKRY
jgi:hypothetical protein